MSGGGGTLSPRCLAVLGVFGRDLVERHAYLIRTWYSRTGRAERTRPESSHLVFHGSQFSCAIRSRHAAPGNIEFFWKRYFSAFQLTLELQADSHRVMASIRQIVEFSGDGIDLVLVNGGSLRELIQKNLELPLVAPIELSERLGDGGPGGSVVCLRRGVRCSTCGYGRFQVRRSGWRRAGR